MTRSPFNAARSPRLRYTPPRNPKLVEAYLLYPFAGAHELAKRTGMTQAEVIEQLERRGLPMGSIFAREPRANSETEELP